MSGNPYFLRDRELSPHRAQRRAKGRVLIYAGWTLRITGTMLGLLGFVVFKSSFESDHWNSIGSMPWWLRLLGAVVAFAVGVAAFVTGRFVVVRGKQHTAGIVESVDRLAGSTYLLYLRPFANDYPDMASLNNDIQGGGANLETLFFISGLTQEEALVRRFRHFGRVVAIGRPGEELPLPGAARAYLPLDDWQDSVSGLIAGAHVVLLSAGPGPGTVWEFTEAVRLLPPTRLLLLAYCDAAAYDLFREAVAEEYVRRSRTEPGAPQTGLWPPLPDLPDFPLPARPERPRWQVALNGGRKRLRWDFALKGLVAFGPDWKATFVRFDPTTLPLVSIWTLHRLVKRELQPVMEQLTALNLRN
ncbi:hypothetical protein ACH4UM_34840 [Streptomyces sp. NPDC020801]|uniref:hypothetical protein n=1 Tax=unclassified Streptomyces TaxID=2593676 RepID=UPI0037A2BC1D